MTLKAYAKSALIAEGVLTGNVDEQAALTADRGRKLADRRWWPDHAAGRDRGPAGPDRGYFGPEHAAEGSALQIARNDLIGADPYETATELEAVYGQIETLYTVTARIAQLSFHGLHAMMKKLFLSLLFVLCLALPLQAGQECDPDQGPGRIRRRARQRSDRLRSRRRSERHRRRHPQRALHRRHHGEHPRTARRQRHRRAVPARRMSRLSSSPRTLPPFRPCRLQDRHHRLGHRRCRKACLAARW